MSALTNYISDIVQEHTGFRGLVYKVKLEMLDNSYLHTSFSSGSEYIVLDSPKCCMLTFAIAMQGYEIYERITRLLNAGKGLGSLRIANLSFAQKIELAGSADMIEVNVNCLLGKDRTSRDIVSLLFL